MTDYGLPAELQILVRTGEGKQLDFSLDDQAGSFTTILPGGCGTFSFQVYGTVPYTDRLLPLGSHVELRDKVGAFWTGLVTRSAVASPYKAGMVQLVASGYSVACNYLKNDDPNRFIHYFTVGGASLEALRSLTPGVISGSTAQIELTALTGLLEGGTPDFLGASAVDVWNNLMSLADVYWAIIPDPHGTDPYPVLQIQARDSGRLLTVSLAAGAVDQVGWDLKDIENQVLVAWTDGSGGTHLVTSAELSDVKYGLTGDRLVIQKFLNAGGDLDASSDAVTMATRAVNRFSPTRVTASTIPIPWGVGVLDGSLADVPLWRVQQGDQLQVEEGDGTSGYLSTEARLVTGTSFDLRTFGLSVQTGERHGELVSQRRRSAERSISVPANLPGVSDRFGPPLTPKETPPKPVSFEPGPTTQSKRPLAQDQNFYLDFDFILNFGVDGSGSAVIAGAVQVTPVNFPFKIVGHKIKGKDGETGDAHFEVTKSGTLILSVGVLGINDSGVITISPEPVTGTDSIQFELTSVATFTSVALALYCKRANV